MVDGTMMVVIVNSAIRMAMLFNARNIPGADATDAEVLSYLRAGIMLSCMYFLTAALGMSSFTLAMVHGSSGANLYAPVSINGKTIDPAKGLKLIRLIVLMVEVLLAILWSTYGLQSVDHYVVARRAYFLCIILAWFAII